MEANRSIVGLNGAFVKLFYATLLTVFFLVSAQGVTAMHVKGGYIQYTYNGTGSASGSSNYTITVTVFFSCTAQGPRTNVYLGIFNASTNALVNSQSINTTTSSTVTKTTYSPCMADPPTVCYEIYTYVYKVDLPDIAAGYVLAVQDAYRTSGIVNISNSSADGITINATIPGTVSGTDYHKNNSPAFLFKDTAIICYNGAFTYPFSATDADGDSLSYSFGNGLNVTNASGNTSSAPPASPPYTSLTYLSGYSGSSPLGSGVTIDPKTGLISGTAPPTTGEYVVAVYVKEWRNGVLINTTKKELQVYVYSCSLSAATLNASYINCDNYTFTFQNEATSSNITAYYWDFGVVNSSADISTQATPTYTYADTGTYTLKLKVSNSAGCTDSTTSPVKVYPGFTPGFAFTGSCYQSPFQFTDATFAKYGMVNSWSWSFGEATSPTNTSSVQNPTHSYGSAGGYTVSLIVGTSKGCSGTVSKTVTANDKPLITMPFTDTLICSIDSLALRASADGSGVTYSWSPAYNIINSGMADPVVYPKDTTVYTVTVTQNGCVGKDSVTVNVLDFITVKLPPDTTICLSDSFQLRPVSYALQYLWSPGATLSDSTIKYPNAAPGQDITYGVTANLGKCQDKASINVHVYPYPKSDAGPDTTICYGATALLSGSVKADEFVWSPDSSLLNSNSLGPVADPLTTTSYILTVHNTRGCPKPVSDTVIVNVIPKVVVFAGNDTSVVVGEPLQLHAASTDSALVSYSWAPTDWLDNSLIYDPVAVIGSGSVDSIVYVATATTVQGCFGSDAVTVKVFKTGPDIFMANAFTPDGDGHNDVFRPVLVGIAQLSFFRVYNRWGQLVFSTTEAEKGWDGFLHGSRQESGTYVYMVQGVDYLGKTHFKKGAFLLIR